MDGTNPANITKTVELVRDLRKRGGNDGSVERDQKYRQVNAQQDRDQFQAFWIDFDIAGDLFKGRSWVWLRLF